MMFVGSAVYNFIYAAGGVNEIYKKWM